MKQQYFKLFFYDCPLKTSQVNLIQLGGIMDRDVNRNKILFLYFNLWGGICW